MTQERREQIKTYIQNELVSGSVQVEDETSLFSSKAISSRNLMHLVDFLEKTFSIKIKPMDLVLENFDTVARIDSYIGRKLG